MLFLVLVGAGVYLAIKFIPPYWAYMNMQEPVREAAMTALTQGGEPAARAELIARAKEQGVTLGEDDIQLNREGSMLVIRVTWVAHVELPRSRHDIPFRVEQRVPLR